jgi:dolichol-phosphate mannosyltransferase
MRGLLKIDFVRFCIVGVSGFLINLVLLTLFYKVFHSPLFVAQILAAEVALFSNFIFHHHWTYKASKVRKTISKLIVQFHVTSWMAIIGSALLVSMGVHVFDLSYFMALVLASGTALFWNFAWSKFVIWRRHSDPVDHSEGAKV